MATTTSSKQRHPTVLVLADYFLPAVAGGGPIRSLDHLTRLDLAPGRITVVTRDRDKGDVRPFAEAARPTPVHRALVHYVDVGGPLGPLRLVRRLLALRTDSVYTNSLFSPLFGLLPLLLWRLRLLRSATFVVAPRGELDPGALRYSTTRKALALRVLRRSGTVRRVRWHATSALELLHLRDALGEHADVRLLPASSAVDVPTVRDGATQGQQPRTPLALVALSRISPKKNLQATLRALIEVDTPVHLRIYGPIDDVRYWRDCLRLIERLPDRHAVTYLGLVAHDEVPGLLASADALVLPTFGENFGHVLFEALAVGCPLVIGPATPWRAAVETGAGWVVAPTDPSDIARALTELAQLSSGGWLQVSTAARRAAQDYRRENSRPEAYQQLFW